MSNDVVPVAWFKHGPYEDGEPLTCVFDDPGDEDCYTALVPQSRVTALQSRIAELEKDAARYRYASAKFVLRDKYSKNDEVNCIGVEEWNFHIDAAIDAAEVSK